MKEYKITATQWKKRVGTKFLAQLSKGGWKLGKTTLKRDINKALETQDRR